LATVAAIDAKIRVGREQDWIGIHLGHADKAGIGEAHWNVRILFQQLDDVVEVFGDLKAADERAALEKQEQLLGTG
jgi:hypothetical protein